MGKKYTAIIAAVILIAVGYYFARQRSAVETEVETPREISSASDAIPLVEGVTAYMLMETRDTGSLSSALSIIPDFVDRMSRFPMPGGIPGTDAGNIAEAIDFLALMRDFADVSEAMAIYATSSDVTTRLYVSMFVDDEKFDSLIESRDRQWQSAPAEEWTNHGGEGDAWILRPGMPEFDADTLYVTRLRIGDKSVVNIAGEEEAIQGMRAAAADPSKRVNIERQTDEPNFIRIKLDEPVGIEGQQLNETELAWRRSDENISIRWYSDIFDDISDSIESGDFTPQAPPVIGHGELALLASIDPMFLIYTILRNEDDPAKAFFERVGRGIPAQFAGDLETILRQCRVSAAIVTSGNALSTAYLTIETAEEGAIDRLFGIASLFLGGRELEGWDSALNVPTGTPLNAIVARRGGTVMFGAGDFEEYGYSAAIPRDLEAVTSRANAFGLTAIPSRLKVNEGFFANMLMSEIESFLDYFPEVAKLGGAGDFDWIDRFTVTQAMDGRVYIDISVRK